MDLIIYFFPLIGAAIGLMLHSIIIHKLIPASKKMLAKNAGRWVGRNLVASLRLDEKLLDPSQFEKIRPVVETHVDEFLRVKLGKQMPMISMFVGDKTIETMKSVFMEELKLIFPQVIARFAGSIGDEIDVEKLVSDRFGAIDDERWKEMVTQNAGSQLNKLRWLGGLTGFIIGVVFLVILLVIS